MSINCRETKNCKKFCSRSNLKIQSIMVRVKTAIPLLPFSDKITFHKFSRGGATAGRLNTHSRPHLSFCFTEELMRAFQGKALGQSCYANKIFSCTITGFCLFVFPIFNSKNIQSKLQLQTSAWSRNSRQGRFHPPGIFLNAINGRWPSQGPFRWDGWPRFAVWWFNRRTILQLSVGVCVIGGWAGRIAGPLEGRCCVLCAVLTACAL